MAKRLLSLEHCTGANPSLFSFEDSEAHVAELAPNRDSGAHSWLVYTSGESFNVYISGVQSSEDACVSVNDIIALQFPSVCSIAFLVCDCKSRPVGIGVCLLGGDVYFVCLQKCQELLKRKSARAESSRKRQAPPEEQKRKKQQSSLENDVVSLLDSDEDDDMCEEMDVLPSSQFPLQSQATNSSIFVSLLDEDQKDQTTNDERRLSSLSQYESAGSQFEGSVVEYKSVSKLWFHCSNCLSVLSVVQIGNMFLFQLQNENRNGSVILHVYKANEDLTPPDISFLTSHSIPIPKCNVRTLEMSYVLCPLPTLVVCHEEGEIISGCAEMSVVSKIFYTQLFPPELSLIKVPLFLVGFPNGNIMYTPLANIRSSVGGSFMGPLCSVEQFVAGLCLFSSHPNSAICNGLLVVGRSGKMLACTEERVHSSSPHFELLHSGFPVLSVCQPNTSTLCLSGPQCVRFVNTATLMDSLGCQKEGKALEALSKTFQGTDVDFPSVVKISPVCGTKECVLALTGDGGLFSLLPSVDNDTGKTSASQMSDDFHSNLSRLRNLEFQCEDVMSKVQEAESSISEVNTALHVFKELQTSRTNLLFLVRQVVAMDGGVSNSVRVKVVLEYCGVSPLGCGWSLLVSVVPDAERLHTIPIYSEDIFAVNPPLSERGQFLSSPLTGLLPNSVSYFYIEVPVQFVYEPLLLTCAVHFCTTNAEIFCRTIATSGVIYSKVLSIFDFFRPVPSNYTSCTHSTSPLPNIHLQGIWKLESTPEQSMCLSYDKGDILRFIGPRSSSLAHDVTSFLVGFLQALLGNREGLLDSGSHNVVTSKQLLPDGRTVCVSVEALKDDGRETVEVSFVSSSYNAVMACANALADKMGTSQSGTAFREHFLESKDKCFQALLLEKNRILRILQELKARITHQDFISKSPLADVVVEVKALNEAIIDAKTQFK